MNSLVFTIILINVISNIKPTLLIPMPPDQADIDLIVDSAYAAEKENKDFEQYLNELNTQRGIATRDSRFTANDQITGKTVDTNESSKQINISFEDYLKDLAALEALMKEQEQAMVEQRVKEIFGIQETTLLNNQQPAQPSIKSCFTLFLNNNTTILEDFVNRIVKHMFSKPAENSVTTKTRENWIKEIVSGLLAELADSKDTNEITKSTNEIKNNIKRTIASGSTKQNVENDKTKQIQKLQEEIFYTPFNKSSVICTNQIDKHKTPVPTSPLLEIDGCDEQCDVIVPYERELIQLALAHARFDQRLLLTDLNLVPMSTTNSADLILALISDVLQLPQLKPLLLQAVRLDDHNILFEMSSAAASLQIIAKTRAYQANLPDNPTFMIEATDANFFDIAMHSRVDVGMYVH